MRCGRCGRLLPAFGECGACRRDAARQRQATGLSMVVAGLAGLLAWLLGGLWAGLAVAVAGGLVLPSLLRGLLR